jgi:hypothetical protein
MSTLRMDRGVVAAAQPHGSRLPARWASRLAALFGRRASRRQRDITAEANQVRELALQVRDHDWRLADDLYAAADRHERLYG